MSEFGALIHQDIDPYWVKLEASFTAAEALANRAKTVQVTLPPDMDFVVTSGTALNLNRTGDLFEIELRQEAKGGAVGLQLSGEDIPQLNVHHLFGTGANPGLLAHPLWLKAKQEIMVKFNVEPGTIDARTFELVFHGLRVPEELSQLVRKMLSGDPLAAIETLNRLSQQRG